MEEYVVYILFSAKYNKTYVVFTSNLLENLSLIMYLEPKVIQKSLDLGMLFMLNIFLQKVKLWKEKNS